MTGTRESITIEIDDADLRARLQTLAARVGRPTDALREIGEVLQQSTQARFASETGPDGQRWAPNSDATLLNYLRRRGGLSRRRTASGGRTLTQRGARALGGKKILTDHGYLGDSIRSQLIAGGQGVAVGTNRVYAALQQFGGTRAQHSQLWGDIPVRPFLGISTDDRARIQEILDDTSRAGQPPTDPAPSLNADETRVAAAFGNTRDTLAKYGAAA